ncbi:MAG: hypothetical protein J6E43_07550 [Prevotella sp.]|nr:hypothetical protein [Prevotella sp.]
MMKKNNFYALLASVMLAAMAGLLTSCTSNDDNPTPSGLSESVIKEKILGKWKRVKEDGEERGTNNRGVLTYFADGKMTYSRSSFSDYWTGYKWYNENPFTYVVSGNVVTREGVEENGRVRKTFEEVAVLSDSEMKLICTGYLMDGQSYSRYKVNEFKRVAVDYSEDIIGTWEGVEMTGDETYGNADARIAYLPDGTYRYYQKNDRGEWELKAGQEVSEYNVDGDWLATRWQEKGGEMNYEWWDIDEIQDGQMKWSALRVREDGTRFTTTFTWKKVGDIAFIIDEEHFPDANFRAELMKQDYGKDGVVTEEERMNVSSINVSNCGIQTLKGIDLFTGIRRLHCYENQLTLLDLSKNTNLTELQCHANQLKELNLANNTRLRTVICSENQLTSLKVASLGMNVLICNDNQLETIDLTGCKALTQFWCFHNRIKGAGMDALIASSEPDNGYMTAVDTKSADEQNVITTTQVAAAKARNWTIYDYNGGEGINQGNPTIYEGSEPQ